MRQNRVLIVVPTIGNRPGWLAECLHSILSQSEPADVVVVGPRSNALERLCDREGVLLHRFEPPGLSRAINAGFQCAEAHHEYVTWLGDDDLLAPGSLRTTVTVLDANPEAVMVHGRTRYINHDGSTRYLARAGKWASWYSSFGWNIIAQPGSLLRRNAVVAIGGLHEDLKQAMDLDLFLRLRSQGKLLYVPKELSAYRWHGNNISAVKSDRTETESMQKRNAAGGVRLAFPLLRALTRGKLDRLVHGCIRRIPGPPPPLRLGRPYTESDEQFRVGEPSDGTCER